MVLWLIVEEAEVTPFRYKKKSYQIKLSNSKLPPGEVISAFS